MKRKTFGITISVLAAVIAALVIADSSLDSRKTWDVCHDMTNTNVTWEQTFRAGALGE